MDFNWIALIVALLGGGGLAVAVREIVSVITLARSGVSGKEDRRKSDIVAQRDFYMVRAEEAEADADAAETRLDNERAKRRIVEDELILARRTIMIEGLSVRPWPGFEDTDPPR